VAARYLVDTSAVVRGGQPTVRERLDPLLKSGQAATCGVIALEILYSTRSHDDLVQHRADLDRTFTNVEILEADFAAAKDLMRQLAARGKHRAAGPADLLIAACARRAGLALLHYDADFDAIASVTGQPSEWVVPRGSVP
jgi:hypothetical protein